MVLQDHLPRLIDKAIDWSFIYDLVEERYCHDNGWPSMDPVPHFSIFGKNYTRHFKDTDLFEHIFAHVLGQCMDAGLVDTSHIFVDATHVKACADSKKTQEQVVYDGALWYKNELKKKSRRTGNEHDSRTFKPLCEEIKGYAPEMIVMDAGYRTPAIAA